MLSTVHIDPQCISSCSDMCMAGICCDVAMETTNIISNVACVGSDVISLSSCIQRLGSITSIWRGNSIIASHD